MPLSMVRRKADNTSFYIKLITDAIRTFQFSYGLNQTWFGGNICANIKFSNCFSSLRGFRATNQAKWLADSNILFAIEPPNHMKSVTSHSANSKSHKPIRLLMSCLWRQELGTRLVSYVIRF